MYRPAKFLSIVITSFLFLALASNSYAKPQPVTQCKKVVIAGNSQWPPYTLIQEDSGNITGVGFELAEQLFSELDVPVEKITFDDRFQMLSDLASGKIDLVVSAYNSDDLKAVADIIEPAYVYDPITVIIPKRDASHIVSWESLVAKRGIMSHSFMVDKSTADYFARYLNVNNHGSLLNMLQAVKNDKFNYAIGSDYQLRYALEANSLQDSLIVAGNLSKGGAVHMAFSKNSLCHDYASYLRKRLQDYKNNGKVEKMIKQYISK